MEIKRFWLSKTFWAGVIEILIGVLGIVANFLQVGDFTAPAIVALVAGALTIVLRFVTVEPIN